MNAFYIIFTIVFNFIIISSRSYIHDSFEIINLLYFNF